VYRPVLFELHSSNFIPNCLSVFGIYVYCVQMGLPSNSTVISTAGVQLAVSNQHMYHWACLFCSCSYLSYVLSDLFLCIIVFHITSDERVTFGLCDDL
jgi:hypothetical protein